METLSGSAWRVKPLTSSVTGVIWSSLSPPINASPVILIGYVPGGIVAVVLIERLEIPGGFTVVGLKFVVKPANSPSIPRVTLPVEPADASTETVKRPVAPCLIRREAGSTLRPNPVPAVMLTVFVFSARRTVPDEISWRMVYLPSVVTLPVFQVTLVSALWEGGRLRALLCR